MKVYNKLAGAVQSALYQIKTKNQGAADTWTEKADDLVKENLPRGSGFNSGTEIVWEKTKQDKIVLRADFFHDTDEPGQFRGWSTHYVILTPDWGGFKMKVTGQNKNQIKEYIWDTFHFDLTKDLA